MDVIEHLLTDVYILPKQVEAEFEPPDLTKERHDSLLAEIGDDACAS